MFTLKKARTIKRRIQISNKQHPFFFDVIESVHIRIPIVNEREKKKKTKLKLLIQNSLLRIDDFIRRSWLRLAENRRLNVVNHRFWWKRQLPLVGTRWIRETRERQNGRMNADSIIYLFVVFSSEGKKKKIIFVINDFYRDRKIRIESRNREFSLIIEM